VKLAILCPGQGGQHPAMLDPLLEAEAPRVLLAACARSGFDPLAAARSGEIFTNRVAQPLICAYQLACWAELHAALPRPALFAGYSLGELAAYGCAGALDARAVIELARARAELMDAGAPHTGLLALRGLDQAQVESLCRRHGATVAIVNDVDRYVVGGALAALAALAQEAGAAEARMLPVGVAAHTPLLAQAGERFRAMLAQSALGAPATPVLAGASAALVRDRASAIDALARQIGTTILWSACLDAAYELGCRVFLELGPSDALSRMVRERFDGAAARSVADFRQPLRAAEWVRRALDD
jgi:[acyl-carrier-protein] S-malonyltransferase